MTAIDFKAVYTQVSHAIASGEKIEREPCGLDWHRRNIRRRLA
jgi:hypothetical protein